MFWVEGVVGAIDLRRTEILPWMFGEQMLLTLLKTSYLVTCKSPPTSPGDHLSSPCQDGLDGQSRAGYIAVLSRLAVSLLT